MESSRCSLQPAEGSRMKRAARLLTIVLVLWLCVVTEAVWAKGLAGIIPPPVITSLLGSATHTALGVVVAFGNRVSRCRPGAARLVLLVGLRDSTIRER